MPAGTPRPIVDNLNAELREALASEETKAVLIGAGADPLSSLEPTPPTSIMKK